MNDAPRADPGPHGTAFFQGQASDPKSSAWVSASAGSGKTHVLVQRVLRLLLDGAPPARILCLTYTKAAAANMATRVFKALSQWTALDDSGLAKAIAATGAPAPEPARLDFARRLFARAIETPGGLKIQTLHAFCERLLHLFPFEANVAAGFRVVVDVEAGAMRARARDAALRALAATPDGAQALRVVAEAAAQEEFDKLLQDALGRRGEIEAALAPYAGWRDYERALGQALGLRRGQTAASIEADMQGGLGGPAGWRKLAERLAPGKPTDLALAGKLIAAAEADAGEARLDIYLGAFFTDAGSPRGGKTPKMVTADLAKAAPGLHQALLDEQARLGALKQALAGAQMARRSAALLHVAAATLAQYAALKNALGALDFDDMIERTLTLMTRSDAAWVHYKLDSGIDHILVDEAQDTSSAQWEILTRLAQDFAVGHGARPELRTFFAVGDEKQSIFSFQGAAPRMFADKLAEFKKRTLDARVPFADVKLRVSFRSSPYVLDAVDKTFARPEAYAGVAADGGRPDAHSASRVALPGRVELWPVVQGTSATPSESWLLPLDAVAPGDPAATLARRVAQEIARWLAPGSGQGVQEPGAPAPRPMRAGDVMILVRTRNAFFEAMIRALKEAHVPVAGADKLKLGEHIAVMDLVAVGRWALNPDDDLSLACALKSPLLGLGDDDLIALAPGRAGSLAKALAGSDAPPHRHALARLRAWRGWAADLTPFAFYARLLGAGGGRKALLGRLGLEALDAIDEFAGLAQAHDLRRPPSLALFLDEIENAEIVVKRDMAGAVGAVRVMTVHASKGLEAPVVFLPDTCKAPTGRNDSKLLALQPARPGEAPLLAWAPKAGASDPEATLGARERLADAAAGEYRRLLYVAMTRAAERLIVAGHCGPNGPQAGCWHEMVRGGLAESMHEVPAPWGGGETILRLASPPHAASSAREPPRAAAPSPPDWLFAPAPQEAAATPLRAAGPRVAPAPGADARGREAGKLSHALLQYLPGLEPARRADAATRYLETRAPEFSPAARAALRAGALRALASPQLAPLFAPDARAEAPIAARFARAGLPPFEFSGRIDRMAILPDAVLFADFKSGARPAGGAPPGYVRQMALYRAALAPIFPAHALRAWIVWLGDASAEELAPGLLDEAFLAATLAPAGPRQAPSP